MNFNMNINIGVSKEIITHESLPESLFITPNDNKTQEYESFAFLIDSLFDRGIEENDDNLQLTLKKNKEDYNTTISFFEINNIILPNLKNDIKKINGLGNNEISKSSEETNHKGLTTSTIISDLEFNHIKSIINDESSSLESSIQENDALIYKQDLLFDINKYGEGKTIGEKNTVNNESSSLESSIQENDALIHKQDLLFDINKYGEGKTIGEKNTVNNESSSLESSIQENDALIHKQDLLFDNITATKREISFSSKNKNEIDRFSEMHQPEVYDNTLIITKQNDNSVRLVLEPDGIGELNIEVSQKEGSINAQFNVVETIGKELLEKNLNDILYSLTEGGVSIGNFSISLKDKRHRDMIKKDTSDGNKKEERITENINRVILHKNDGNISIIV